MVDVYPGGQTRDGPRCQVVIEAWIEVIGRVMMHLNRCLRAVRLGLFEDRRDVVFGDGVGVQAGLQTVQPERCQHEQPRDERDEQPSHKAEVNTPKVSAGSRIATGQRVGFVGVVSRVLGWQRAHLKRPNRPVPSRAAMR